MPVINRKLFFFFICFQTLNANAQEVPKKTNVIVIKGVSYKEAINALLDHHYMLESYDSSLQIIKTDRVKSLKYSISIGFFIRIKDSSAILTGVASQNAAANFGGTIATPTFFAIKNNGLPGSPMKNAWKEMNSFALSFNKPVEYLIE